jgi:hypothetical protein
VIDIQQEIRRFSQEKTAQRQEAAQTAALFLAARLDLPAVLGADEGERARVEARLGRLIERERLRGMRRHWSYDLNRHIALKQALDRVRAGRGEP